jgi:L1 cell adhesion molecule like protein
MMKWLDSNQMAEKDEFEQKYKELEVICSALMNKLYQNNGGIPGGIPGGMPGGMHGGMPDGMHGGIDEVD